MARSHNVFRDGKLHVLSDRCATCIFRNPKHGGFRGLKPGRRAEMVRSARADEGHIPCHETYGKTPSICRGFWDLPHQPAPLQIADRLGFVEYVDPPAKEEFKCAT